MAKTDGKLVDVSRKEVFEVKIGNTDPVLLSKAEATQLYEGLKKILPGEEYSTAVQTPTRTVAVTQGEGLAGPAKESVPALRKSMKFTPERRRHQNILMSGIIIIVIGLAFIAADVHTLTAPAAPSFKPPPQPYTHFYIDAGPHASFTFNGTSPGPTLSVPVNTRVWVSFHVSSSAGYPHSWVLVPGNTSPTPNPNLAPVFANATSPNPIAGSPVGSTDQIVFVANASGSYKYICEFPGHFESGMWGWLNVTSNKTSVVHVEHYHLVAGINGTQTFNGTTPGPALTAPNNSMVWLTLSVSASSATNHSWILVPGNVTNTTAPNYTSVFRNASSPNPTAGDAKNTTLQIYFNVTKVGNYKYISEVSTDFKAGMWGLFNVTKSNYSALTATVNAAVTGGRTQSVGGTPSVYHSWPGVRDISCVLVTPRDSVTLPLVTGMFAKAAGREAL